ncbi:phage tail sheath family protein [Ectothiorhodospira lacustris]|uniref:phage tail sheath family protein n=1 Tax=Ectothiorhodospira lacustris TaxID=2899127 RepID=UPI001EE84E98|nr:phage tail sheath subtilisin-like domain-containing protein [Ectothiorhodospira lacustris]MCG5511216.1 phage tail sheath subtilisin-like domain-containing protein [Ectothiorhodospira lacustris]MCG5522968.1 phage tail sheath subtilisin-like domain-containing protein [Ectothiorhodospira lacustris]
MGKYLAPGVYVEEVPSGARPIQAVGTSTAGFVGIAPLPSAHPQEAVGISNWTQFLREFVSNGGDHVGNHLAQAVYGFFLNGGSRCYVVNCQSEDQLTGSHQGVNVLETVDEVAIVAAPGMTGASAYDAVLSHCELMENRVAILDGAPEAPSMQALIQVATEGGRRRQAGSPEAEAEPAANPKQVQGLRPRNSDQGYGAVYFPWIVCADPFRPGHPLFTPPSGHLAGIYARCDARRGVHKAPANESIRGALDVRYRLTRQEQAELNPQGVNCIRFFPGEGIRVWGARTLAPAAGEWRYINVRRLFNMVKESIALSTRWVVFEPNDEYLWKAIVRDVSAFLTLLWRQGALQGGTPEEAFFVQCDAVTNPQEVIDAGRVVTRIGLAPVKPAEFVIFQIGQGSGGVEREAPAGG